MSPHTYSGLDRGCSHRFSHIHTIFAPYSRHIRAIFTRIRTVFAPHSHHIRTYSRTFAIGNDDDKGDDDDMDDDKGNDDDNKGDDDDDSFAGDSTRFVRFAPDSQDSHRIRTVFALYSHVFAQVRGRVAACSTLIHTYSRIFIPIHTCEYAERVTLQ